MSGDDRSITFETVRQLVHELPDVEDGLSYGAPALKVKGRMFARHREELNAVVLKTTFEEREELMAADPQVYFITDHYLNYEYVLVSFEHVNIESLTDIVRRSYNIALAGNKRK